MSRRVLVCIHDTGVAHVVASRLQKDGIDGVVVDGPDALGSKGDGRVDAVVVQDRYPGGQHGRDLLDALVAARSSPVNAVYLLTGELLTGEEDLLRSVGVQSFLRTEATPHSIASAAAECAEAANGSSGASPASPGEDDSDELDLDIILHEDEQQNEFDISVDSTAAELDAMTFDGDSDEQTVEVAAIDLDALRKNLEANLPSGGGGVLGTQLDGDPATVAQSSPTNHTVEVEVPMPLDGMTLDGAMFDRSEILKRDEMPSPGEAPKTSGNGVATDEGAVPDGEDDFELPSLPPPKGSPAPLSVADQQPVELEGPQFEEEEPEDEAPPLSDVADSTAESKSDIKSDESQRNEAMQMQELKKALLAQQKARKSAEERVKDLEIRLTQLEPADAKNADGVPEAGALEDVRYPVLLSRCRNDGFTGKIELHIGDQAQRTIYLRDGLPVGYASSEPGERIGKMMVEQGRITDEEYIKASMAMVERGIRLTEAMVELGFIEGEKLAVEMRNLTRDQIIHGFETTQGRFATSKGAEPDGSVATFDFGPGEIYVQGYRQYAPQQEMLSLFESLRDTYLKAGDRLASFRPKLGLTSEDEKLIRLLGEAYTVEEAVEQADLDPESSSRLLAALQALDLVEAWSPGVEQFRARLMTERQKHAEEIARIRGEMSAREKELFAGFERALSKIGSVTGGGLQLDTPRPPTGAQPRPSDMAVGPVTPDPPAARITVAGPTPPAPSASIDLQSTVTISPPPPGADSTIQVDNPGNGVAEESSFPGVDVGTPPSADDGPLSAADLKYTEGLEQARQNKLDEAEVTLREAVRMDATKPHYLLSLARVLLENPRYERAGTLPVVRSLLDRAVQIAPADGDVLALHGEVVQEMGG